MKKLPLYALSISLIILGWVQEVYYYWFTFNSIGLGKIIPFVAGVSLSLLLGYFALHKKLLGFTLLCGFSVCVTIIGQVQSLEAKNSSYTLQTALYTELLESKQRYTLEIETINDTIQLNENLLPKTIQERANWATKGVKPLEEKIDKLKAEKADYEGKLQDVINQLSTGTKQPTLFENIAKDVPFISATVLQYAFMSFMSLFIALMAPAGIRLLSTGNTQQKQKPKKRVVEVENTEDEISVYVNSRFGESSMPSVLNSRKEVVENTSLSYGEFNELSKRAVRLGLISVQGNKSVPVVNKGKFEMMLRNGLSVDEKVRGVR